MADSPEAIRKHQKFYLIIGAPLLLFTFVTVLVARPGDIVPGGAGVWLAKWLDVPPVGISAGDYVLGLLIATVKASLVALIFMHLNAEKGLIYKFLVFTAIFALGMVVLILLHGADPIAHDAFR